MSGRLAPRFLLLCDDSLNEHVKMALQLIGTYRDMNSPTLEVVLVFHRPPSRKLTQTVRSMVIESGATAANATFRLESKDESCTKPHDTVFFTSGTMASLATSFCDLGRRIDSYSQGLVPRNERGREGEPQIRAENSGSPFELQAAFSTCAPIVEDAETAAYTSAILRSAPKRFGTQIEEDTVLVRANGVHAALTPGWDRWHTPNLVAKGVVDQATYDFRQSTLTAGDVVVHVGALTGAETLHMAALVGDEGHVFASEGHPGYRKFFESNVKLNRFHNITFWPLEISNDNAASQKFTVDGWSGPHPHPTALPRRGTVANGGPGEYECESGALEALLPAGVEHIDFVFLDNRGGQCRALRSIGPALLSRIQCFVVSALAESFGKDWDEFISWCADRVEAGWRLECLDDQVGRRRGINIDVLSRNKGVPYLLIENSGFTR